MGKMLPRKIDFSLLLIGLMICFCITNDIVAAADLQCYHCDAEDCEDPEVKACTATTESDQCYVRLDNNNDIIGMGCASVLGNQTVVSNLIKNKELYVCSTTNCNGFENLPDASDCTKCDSQIDERCATQPRGVKSHCGVVPYTQCYERVNLANGTTERGCLFDLASEDFFKCVSGDDINCRICAENGCNIEIIPTGRAQCQRCVSVTDSSCSSSPAALSVCPIYVENDSCVSQYDSGVTQRGCASELPCNTTARNCQICTSSGCNIADIQARSQDLYGIFQELPLNCNTCAGDECQSGRQNLRKCQGNIHQDCLSVFDSNGTLVARGCQDALDTDYLIHCDTHPALCFSCKANGCNNLNQVPQTIDCLYCDTTTDTSCVNNVLALNKMRTCAEGCLTKLYENKTNQNVFELARTCYEDLELDDRETCTEENNCVKCSDEKCNKIVLPAEGRLSCLHCDGDDCDDPIPKLCSSYWPADQCYIYFDPVTNNAIDMGCKSSLPETAILNDILHYYVCDGDDCNSNANLPEAHYCYACNSAYDLNCITNPASLEKNVTLCQTYPHTDCYSRITGAGHTERGCTGALNISGFLTCHQGSPGQFCRICTESYCNANSYPSGRQRCYRCNSLDDPNCETRPQRSTSTVCPLFDEDDFCISKWVDGIVYRGCGTEFQCEENSTYRTCSSCENFNCNTDLLEGDYPIGNPGLFQDLPLNCYQCNGTRACTDTMGKIQKCDGNIYQTCATAFSRVNGSVIGRGCSDAFTDECNDGTTSCYNCKSNGCNVATDESQYINCIFCDGRTNDDCVNSVSAVRSNRKCYESCVTTLYNRTNDTSSVREVIRTCLDDLDLDDREACASGNDENCKVCSENKCNTVAIGTHHSCYQCVGDECQVPVAKRCHAVAESDQCFVRYDERRSIVELGCKSNYDADELKELIVAKQLWLCNGENCNTIDATPVEQTCIVCSSLTNKECAVTPSWVQVTTKCSRTPYTQCYSRILDSGHTERGCLSSIQGGDFYDCLMGTNSTKCLACTGKTCNSQVFPAERRSCQQCDSKTDLNCESAPEANAVCLLYHPDEYCTVKLVNDITYRGCSQDLTCDGLDKQSCRECFGKNDCNMADLASKNIGEPGRWQELPLNCYDCEGAECVRSNGVLRKCQLNNLQTCQTVFGTNDRVVRRGCSDVVDETYDDYCNENPNKCLGCKSNGCNNATRLTQYIECYNCDSGQNPYCGIDFESKGNGVNKTRKCQGHCAVALLPRSSAPNPSYELARTCLDDLDLDDREACLYGQNKFCTACNRDLCNIKIIPENRHKCYKCVEEDCADYEVQLCAAYKENDQCYMSFDSENSLMGMGCRSEFEDDIIDKLIKQKKFIFCDGVACNGPETIPTPTICTACDSRIDSRCATNPNLVTDVERCRALPYTDCYTRVKEDGHTARGCLSTLDADTFYRCLVGNDTLCQSCVGDKCNSLDVFPANRWTCQQCNSEDDPLCATAPNNNKVCPMYNERETCITTYKNGVTIRGCASSLECEDSSDNSTCRSCNTRGCNTINLDRIQSQGRPGRWQDVPITCGTCEGEQNCDGIGNYRVCTGNLYQSCMTIFNEAGKVIQRGCSDALEEAYYSLCETNPGNCLRCNSNGCNNATQLTDYIDCLYCDDTNRSGNCVENVNEVRKTRKCNKYCMTALYAKFDELNPAYGITRSCFDDMDLDDREACAAGTMEHCQVCDNEKCNMQLIPSTRLSCMACEAGDCENPKPTTCATYRADDQCYMQFDEDGSVYAMGCRSEFSNADAYNQLSQKRVLFCSGNDCNTNNSIPETQTCIICSSRTDIKCAINPAELNSTTLCARRPYTDCYTRVLPSGVTERGCLSSLYDDEFVGCWNGTSSTCQSCSGYHCNKQLYPETRLSCHICDSAIDPKCAFKPNNVSRCPLYMANDSCVTAYINDVTYRGCSSSIQCDPTQTNTCAQCDGEACNTINLERKQDDNHGKWQDLPLTCLSCSGDSCLAINVTSLKCENNNEQDCMTVFENNRVVRRGCSDIVEAEFTQHCESDWTNCPNCKSNNCNNATAHLQYNTCIYCDTSKNQSCVWDPTSASHKVRSCQGACMTVLYPSDDSNDPAYELIRTCLDDKEAMDQLTCAKGRDGYCQSCTGSRCNTAEIPRDRHHCYQCEGDDCEEPLLFSCPLYKSNDHCFTTFDDSNTVIQMGCTSSFRNQMLETIIGTKRIHVCDGVGCNSLDSLPIAHRCAVCNSNNDYACATNAAETGSFSTCSQYPYTDCYTRINNNDGSTLRGCLSDLPTTEFVSCVLGNDKNCSTCIGDGCNREVFPTDRQQCYTCSSDDDDDCVNNPTRLLPCPYISDTETCRTAYGGNITVRGCRSEVFCDTNERSTCRDCIGTACNGIDLSQLEEDDGFHGVWQDLPLRCHTCEGEHCLYSLGPAYNCSGNLDQDCATVFTANGDIRRRGCADDVENYEQRYCRENPHLCFKCKSNECNDAWNITEYVQCNYCTSKLDEACAVDPEHGIFVKRQCKQECMVAMKETQIIRSCLDDKEQNERYICRVDEGGTQCASCNTADCNDFAYPKDRLKCHVCNDPSCSTTMSLYCHNYTTNDYCFAKYESGNVELMGCASSQNSIELAEWATQRKLYACRGNDCNELQQLPKSGGRCLSCNSANEVACAQNPFNYVVTESCPPLQDECVTYVDEAGHTRRGCLSLQTQNGQKPCEAGKCSICTGNICNNEIFPFNRLACHICNSNSDSNCAASPNHLQICPIYSENDRCVTIRTDHIERGCESHFGKCNNTRVNCETCEQNGCNIAEFTDAALTTTASLLTTLILAMLAVLGYRFN
ncbi:uncharacterized protein [Eurosta solidaginis]|uniref:uncharacterized protein n=1 Tax=Eurosta solidaginis TaxID=178769 RepID=UPI003530DADA